MKIILGLSCIFRKINSHLFSHANLIIGPENWGGACDTGMKQSPVDLSFKASVRGKFPEFHFEDYEEPIVGGKILNTGHSSKYLSRYAISDIVHLIKCSISRLSLTSKMVIIQLGM